MSRGRTLGAAAMRRAAPCVRAVPGLRDFEKVFQEQMAVLGRNALGMKLHAVHRQPAMCDTHDETIPGFGGHVEVARQAVAIDHQRMIPRRVEWRIDAAKNAGAAVLDFRQLAVHRHRRPPDLAAESLADPLMAETDAENRDAG